MLTTVRSKASRSERCRERVAGSTHDVLADLPSIALTDDNPSIMATVAADRTVTLIIAIPRSGRTYLTADRIYPTDRGAVVAFVPTLKIESFVFFFYGLRTVI